MADPEGGLDRVRALFLAARIEIARDTYISHVTVGLYSGASQSGVVSEKRASFPKDLCRLTVDRITSASYRAQEMARILTRRHEIALRFRVIDETQLADSLRSAKGGP